MYRFAAWTPDEGVTLHATAEEAAAVVREYVTLARHQGEDPPEDVRVYEIVPLGADRVLDDRTWDEVADA